MDPKERIQEKARELFMSYGIRSVSMDDIASNLGMSKKTIYQSFADKDELVDAVFEGEMSHTHDRCMQCSRTSKDAIAEIFQTIEDVHGRFSQMNPMIIYDLQKFHPKTFEKFRKMKDEFLAKVVADNLKRGIEEELYRPDINIEIMSRFRVESMMLALTMPASLPHQKYSLAQITRETMEHFVFGVASIKGYKQIVKYKEQQLKQENL